MNEIAFQCPNCGQALACDEQFGGAQILCPACRQAVAAPRGANALEPAVAEWPAPAAAGATLAPPVQAPVERRSSMGRRLAPAGLLAVLLAKSKAALLLALKFAPLLLKTGGTMLVSIWAYAQSMGWPFAVGFVVLIFVHECGHLVAAKRLGLKVGAPVFIPFMGALIALKEAPRNAWIEAQVGIGGPLLGALGAAMCLLISISTGSRLFAGLAYTGFFLNLFNLAPVGFLDGGRVVTALSPWLWVVGLAVIALMLASHPNFLLALILVLSLPRLFSLFRRRTEAEARYFEVAPAQRRVIGALYFGLAASLIFGMELIRR